MLGLYFELSNPGAILPGVVGAICLILAFFALSVLPVNYAGIALILLAVIFFIAEIKVVSYGLLSVGGLISLVLGSLMLFKSADPAIRVSLDVIFAITVFAAAVVAFLLWMVLKVHRSRVTTGVEGLVSKVAEGAHRSRSDGQGLCLGRDLERGRREPGGRRPDGRNHRGRRHDLARPADRNRYRNGEGVLMPGLLPLGIVVVLGLFLFSRWINILNEYERAVVFRLGRILEPSQGPRAWCSSCGRSTAW